MSKATAERWVTISAVIVAGIYAYRRLTEPATAPLTLKSAVGVGPLPPLGAWATAWGFTYLVLAVMTEASPGLGGSFAILIATSDLLTNSASVFSDVGQQQQTSQATAGPPNQAADPGIGTVDQSRFLATPLVPPPAAAGGTNASRWDQWFNSQFNAGYLAASHTVTTPHGSSPFNAGVDAYFHSHPSLTAP